MKKCSINLKKRLTIASLATLLLLSILTLTIGAMMPMAKAQPTMTLNPNWGPPGTYVTVYGFGFALNGQVTISIFTTQLGTLEASSDVGDIATQIQIPSNVAPGSYAVTASDNSGNSVSATFTVTQGTTRPPTTPTPSASAAPTISTSAGVLPTETPWTIPTVKPVQTATANGGTIFSPLVVAIIVVAIVAILIPTTMFYRRRGSGETLAEDATPAYKPGVPSATSTPATFTGAATATTATLRYPSSSYNQQLTRPTLTPRPSQPSRYDGMAATRMCPGCKRPVKDYYSVCPYCHRKLK